MRLRGVRQHSPAPCLRPNCAKSEKKANTPAIQPRKLKQGHQNLATQKQEESMSKLLETVGNVAAVLGILVCLVSGLSRLAGTWYMAGFQAMVLFNVGIGLMVMGCLAKLHLLGSR